MTTEAPHKDYQHPHGPRCEHQPYEYFDADARKWVAYGECEDCLSDHCEPNGDPCRCAVHSYRRATREVT